VFDFNGTSEDGAGDVENKVGDDVGVMAEFSDAGAEEAFGE
jgi:hypothetical protein